MLRTSGNTLKTNNSTNVNNVNCGTNNNNSINKSNLLNSAGLVNSDYMLPINNLSNNNNQMATSSFLNDYNKLYRDLGILHQQNQHSNLIGNNSMNSLVVNNLTNNIGSHTNNLNNLPNHNNNVNGLPNHNNLNVLPSNLQQQQSNGKNISNEFLFYLNRCNQYLSLNMYQNALDDSNQALNIASNSSEARFRKAQALLGLKRFYDCEKELWTCIKLDPSSIEYRKELVKLKQIALMSLNLNLDQNVIIMASQKYDTIKEAVEALLWQNNMDNFPYSPFNNNANNSSNLSDSLINGWGLANNNNTSNNNSNRFRSNFNPINNQLVNNGNNLLFSNNLLSNVNNNLLLNNSNLINRSNNGNSLNNNCVNSSTAQTSNNNVNSGLNSIKNNSTTNSTTTANLNNNLINSNNSSNQNNSTVIGNQSSNNSVNNTLNDTNNNANLISNGLSNVSLNNGNNRFNFLLRGLDSQAHLSQLNSQQTTNGQNSNQNLINNNIYNRIMPTFIENNNSSNMDTKNHAAVTNNQILNCSRNLNNKMNSNSNSILNGTNGLLMMNNNNAPSPICSKINNGINSNLSSNSTSLTNSCNFNPFNQLPDVKLIETIVPNLLTLGNSTTSSLNNSDVNDSLANSNSNKLKMFSSVKKEVNNNLKDNPKIVDSFNVSKKDSNIMSYEDCNKSANNIKNNATKKSSDLDTNDLIKSKDLDLKSVTNVVDDNNLINSNLQNNVHSINSLNANSNTKTVLNNEENNLSTSILNNNQNNNGTFVVNSASANNTIQSTSYSDIVKRAKKVTQNALGNTNSNNNSKSDGSAVSVKNENEIIDDASIATKRPTNLWAYNGLRVANVSLTASKSSLLNLFSKFGRIRLLERIINKTTTNNIWVYYDNPVSPVDAVAKLQNIYIENICVDTDSPLRLFFAPTDDQKDLKFSRPKQPPDNKGECYYWRTTNCFSKDQCPLLHLQPNKNIDAQIWMKMNKEPEDTDVVPTANTTCSTSTSTSAENNETTSDL